jgi:alkanesulfonate monooxygenase SsuD/methylene tetrahydromethanopterin reductase-like flavin-dependent oxidoreductase (luciferase family)
MRVGVSLRSAYAGVGDVRQGARWMVERAAAAREAGLDSLFVGDHHNTGPAVYYQNSPILGRLLGEWGDAPAGALYLLPLWHPVLVAEQVGTLASLAQGRFILQCAVGGGAEQFAGMGVDMKERARLFERNLDTVRRLLAGEAVGAARVAPVPPEPVEVWVGGSAPAAVDRAARMGDGWILGPWETDEEAAALARAYRERCEVHGRTPAAVALRRDIHVGRDDADARAAAGPVVEAGYRGLDPASLVVGGPGEVSERFARYAEMGYTDVIVRHLVDQQDEVLGSLARLGGVRQALAGVEASGR